MKFLITLAFCYLIYLGGKNLIGYWGEVTRKSRSQDTEAVETPGPAKRPDPKSPATTSIDPSTLPGLPPTLEPALQKAQAQGPVALKQWIDQNRRYLKDPRLAWLELDYVVQIATLNRAEARKVLADLASRLPPNSPVYPRFKKLAETYQ